MCYFWFPNDLIISSQRKNKAEPITVKQTAQAILSSYMLASANEYTVQRNHNLFTKKKKKSHKNLTSQENCLQWIIQPSVTSSWAPSLFLTWSISFSFFSFLFFPLPPSVTTEHQHQFCRLWGAAHTSTQPPMMGSPRGKRDRQGLRNSSANGMPCYPLFTQSLELEGTHKDHRVQPLAPHSTMQMS